ncbi:DUF4097 family beta strand repeat-containing protein [Lapillicoccus sp.]|uniref:DUF4097 family beta strand repeat-containing protein n=1 Tax=Lapillicoccus sp. TaxID=1909287 RepID=UPI00398338AB
MSAQAQQWRIEGPKVLDIGDEHERVTRLTVAVVGGRVDVVTHDDSPTARVEVTGIEGLPLVVSWDGGTLRVTHGKDSDKNVLDMLRRTFESVGRSSVLVSISVPVDTRTAVSTVTAAALVSGVRASVKANTVSGTLTLSDLHGDLDLNTVSGNVECHGLSGPLTVNAISGTVTVQGSDLPTVRINTVSGDIALDLTTAHSKVTSNSVSGDVTVRAPLTGFDVEGNTASGQVVVDGRQVSRGGRHGHSRGGRIREGDGALEIKANAVSGNIVVLRGESRSESGPQDAAHHDWPAVG